jgi:dTDP-4-amino-4,6-dideoxygalactose transaminase
MVPFSRPTRAPGEIELVAAALQGQTSGSDAYFGDQCAELLQSILDSKYATPTPSCTGALEMAALVLGIGRSDEVIVPSFTFTSTANAFMLRGARVVFADILEDTLCLDPQDVERHVSPRTRTVVAMHYGGIACDMPQLTELCRSTGASLVEDAAHGLFGKLGGRALGTIGDIGAFSFHRSKNLTCGEGGAFVTDDAGYAAAAETIREKGTNRREFIRKRVAKYEWIGQGSSYVLAELLAAQLLAQLRGAEEIQARRRKIWMRYQSELSDWARREGVAQPHIPPGCEPAWHLYHLMMRSERDRDRMLGHLRARGIGAAFHYPPLHLTPFGRRLGGKVGDAPVSEGAASRIVRLPFYTDLGEEEQDEVIDAVQAFETSASRTPHTRGRVAAASLVPPA